MKKSEKMKMGILAELVIFVVVLCVAAGRNYMYKRTVPTMYRQSTEGTESTESTEENAGNAGKKDFIRWVDFTVTCEALDTAYEWDVNTYGADIHINWIDLLALEAAKCGGDFSESAVADMDALAQRLADGTTKLKTEAETLKYYNYYRDAYTAVLGGLVGEYEMQKPEKDGTAPYRKAYGLKGFSPIAKGFEYRDYDDFGVSRTYGFEREHLGHDMMGQIGTPVIAVESGYVEALGWNQYGGWRIGIRSFDHKRYYYYAHLRQDYPYAEWLKEGGTVKAGDVIGYMGHTGYSTTENVNNIDEVHLHFGLELIFDESQKDSDNEIWVSCYELTRFLKKNQMEVRKIDGTKEWERCYDMKKSLYNSGGN